MSKAVRWQVPFTSRKGTQYRVDIYDEGYTGTPVQLLAGDTPFVTDEDDSDDFFAPARTQTGTLQICTQLPDGTMLDINDIMPENNIARPIRLINVDSSAIEWQGFLSCESYDQDYIGVPQQLDLPVKSVLEAMDSVNMSQDETTGVIHINQMIVAAIEQFNAKTGMDSFVNIVYSAASREIFECMVETNVLFEEEEEIQLENSMTYETDGVSCLECIKRICTYMGWVAREQGADLYMQRIGEEVGMYSDTLANFKAEPITNATFIDDTVISMEGLSWAGDQHRRSIKQGAKKVEVVASLKSDEIDISLPTVPCNNMTEKYGKQIKGNYNGSLITLYVGLAAEQNDAYYGNQVHRYFVGDRMSSASVEIGTENITEATRADFIRYSAMFYGDVTDTTRYAGAAFCQYSVSNEGNDIYAEVKSGLYCTLLPNVQDGDMNPIFSITTNKVFSSQVRKGGSKLVIKGKCHFIGYDTTNSRPLFTDNIEDNFLAIHNAYIRLGVRWGDYVYNDDTWEYWGGDADIKYFDVQFDGEGFEAEIPVDIILNGQIELAIYANCKQKMSMLRDTNTLHEIIIDELDVTQEFPNAGYMRDVEENKYVQILHTYFDDEISVETKWATDNNNQPSQRILYKDEELMECLEHVVYHKADGTTEERVPERDLLNRLADYYSAARRILKLETEHPDSTPLPLMLLHGLNEPRIYLPLAESRDWQEDTSELTCMEIGQANLSS